jgi:O-succinylbenzoic acid--CoA ligase
VAAPGGFRYLIPGAGAALAWLRGHGLDPGARLGLVAENTPTVLALLQAAALGGVCVVLVNRRLDAAARAAQAASAGLDAWIGPADVAVKSLVLPTEFALAQRPDPAHLTAPEGERPALVLFTSGTTGTPKAARLSVRALASAARAATERLALSPADTWIACLGLDHIGGASFAWRAAVCGHRLRLVERFAPAAVNALIDGGDSGISVVPTMLHRLIAERGARADPEQRRWPATLRVLLTGGGPLPDALAARSAALGVEPSQTYGLSECASQVCTLHPAASEGRGSAGVPLPGAGLRIVSDDGDPAPPGAVGRIEVRGPMLFSGYEERGTLPLPQVPTQWFNTGDLGHLDDDGRLHVHCRRSDLIVTGGENVYPAQLEAALAEHPRVAQAAVWGEDDEEWGQVVTAALVAAGPEPAREDFSAWMAARLPGFQRPRRWAFVAELPLTANGKLARARLRGWLGSGGGT